MDYKLLESYIERRIHPERRERFIPANRLGLIFEEPESSLVGLSRIRTRMIEGALFRITEILRFAGIEPVHFKGMTLAYLLYEQPERRVFSDIDFYIEPAEYPAALRVLTENGLTVQEDFDGHHITLSYREISVEMHSTYFHPNDGIAFAVKAENLRQFVFKGRSLTTFDPTFQFLFLFLHYFTHARKGQRYCDEAILTGRYFFAPVIELSRLYDIALLTERFGDEIDWRTCISYLAPFKGCEEFQCVLSEFSDVFPSVLPDCFLKDMRTDVPPDKERFPFFHRMMSEPERYFESIVADIVAHDGPVYPCFGEEPENYRFFVDEYDEKKSHTYLISGIPPRDGSDLSFGFDFWIRDGRLWFALNIKDDVLNYLTDGVYPERPDSIGFCDGFIFHIVPSDGRYELHRLYFFLTQNDSNDKFLSAYDINESAIVRIDSIVNCSLIIRADGYTARVGIPLGYLDMNESSSFYFNVMVSDSDDEKGCETVLAFDSSPTAWKDCRTYPIGRIVDLK